MTLPPVATLQLQAVVDDLRQALAGCQRRLDELDRRQGDRRVHDQPSAPRPAVDPQSVARRAAKARR